MKCNTFKRKGKALLFCIGLMLLTSCTSLGDVFIDLFSITRDFGYLCWILFINWIIFFPIPAILGWGFKGWYEGTITTSWYDRAGNFTGTSEVGSGNWYYSDTTESAARSGNTAFLTIPALWWWIDFIIIDLKEAEFITLSSYPNFNVFLHIAAIIAIPFVCYWIARFLGGILTFIRRWSFYIATIIVVGCLLIRFAMFLFNSDEPSSLSSLTKSMEKSPAKTEKSVPIRETRNERSDDPVTDVRVQHKTGLGYYHAQDYAQAVAWFRKAADQGFAAAQNELGSCYYLGNGVSQDYAQAVHWFRKAADQGDRSGQWNLGVCYVSGNGVSQDHEQAARWYRKAAEQGHVEAQNALANCYYYGKGVRENHEQAVHWFRRAAEQGNADAQFCLGGLYALGTGVDQDTSQALFWLQKAADQGHETAIKVFKDAKEKAGLQ